MYMKFHILIVCSFQFAQWFEVDHGFVVEIRWLRNSYKASKVMKISDFQFYPQVRPLVGQEKVHNVPQCVHFIPDKPQLILGKDRGFTFDYVFPPKTSQVRR